MAATAVAVAGVGLATVVLGYHRASDVAAGWLLGRAVVLPALRALRPSPASAARTRVSAQRSAQARTERPAGGDRGCRRPWCC
jgi:membrane-associated phospholipid phosphatase